MGPGLGVPDAALRQWLREWTERIRRAGFGNAYAGARGEVWAVNRR